MSDADAGTLVRRLVLSIRHARSEDVCSEEALRKYRLRGRPATLAILEEGGMETWTDSLIGLPGDYDNDFAQRCLVRALAKRFGLKVSIGRKRIVVKP